MFKLSIGRFTKSIMAAFASVWFMIVSSICHEQELGFIAANIGTARLVHCGLSTGFNYVEDISTDEIFTLIQQLDSKMKLTELFQQDSKTEFSELGGFITKSKEGLHFYVTDSEYNQLYFKLNACDDWHSMRDFIKENQDTLENVIDSCAKTSFVKNVISFFDDPKQNDRNKEICMHVFKGIARSEFNATHKKGRSSLIKVFAKMKRDEQLIAGFHLHPERSDMELDEFDKSFSMMKEIMFRKQGNRISMWIFFNTNASTPDSAIPTLTFSAN